MPTKSIRPLRFAASVCLLLLAALSIGNSQKLILTNPLPVDRTEEVIEIPLEQVLVHLPKPTTGSQNLVAENSGTHQTIPTQLYSNQPGAAPDTLLLLVKLPAKGSIKISFHITKAAPAQPPLVFGREAVERKDDFAWENLLVAYRVYGPALEATGEIASGIDVWSKRVPNFVIDSFYQRDAEGARTKNPALSYHKDNGVGLDSYYVGPTRGCGGTAVWANGTLFASKNYTTKKVLSTGPIRFAFEVTYAPWKAGETTVTETKRITLDAGSHLNQIQSTYTFTGTEAIDLAAGLAVHADVSAQFLSNGNVASVWDTPQDPSAGRIATGLVALPAEHGTALNTANHALMLFHRHSGEPFTYYAGSAWSKADMPTSSDWNAYLQQFLNQREHPLTLHWTNH